VSSTEMALWQRHEAGPIRGDIANLYQAGPGLLKLARDPADNDLMRREAAALRHRHHDLAVVPVFPELLGEDRPDAPRVHA